MTSAKTLYRQHSRQLVDERDFSAFKDVAEAIIDEDASADNARALEGLLREVVNDLIELDAADDAAAAIDRYVADVLPILDILSLPVGDLGTMASDAGVRDRLSFATTFALFQGQAAIGRPANDQIADADANEQEDDNEGDVDDEDQDDLDDDEVVADADNVANPARKPWAGPPDRRVAAANVVTYNDVCDIVTRTLKRRRLLGREKRITLLMTGLSQNGKSFFVQRLLKTLGGDYSALDPRGNSIDWAAKLIDRTQDILYFDLVSNSSRPSIGIFDIPGEAFLSITNNSSAHQDRVREAQSAGGNAVLTEQQSAVLDLRRSIYALYATVDAMIMIEPALHTLQLEHFSTHGDIIHVRTQQDQIAELESKGLSPAQFSKEKRAIESNRTTLDARVAEHQNFTNSIGRMANDIHRIRSRAKRTYRGNRDALTKGVEHEIGAITTENFKITAPLPLLLILSRADEFRRVIADNDPDFDVDPALSLAEWDCNRFKHYSRWFETFSVDFVTADEKEQAEMTFSGKHGGQGTHDLVDQWLLPAIRRSRRPRPLSWFGAAVTGRMIARKLRSPVVATGVRWIIDSQFRAFLARRR